jgi:Tol biopolymer transport system component
MEARSHGPARRQYSLVLRVALGHRGFHVWQWSRIGPPSLSRSTISGQLTLSPGSRLGDYEVIALLGVGGMGEVYRATDTNLKRQVALKVLPASVAGDAERLTRFQLEAQVVAALNHPHIAQIYGIERTAEATALVMELVEGEDLAHRLARGPLPLDEAVPIARQIAEALEAAHEQGIVHRDLKPPNIMVRRDGTVKVLDFGVAKALETRAHDADPATTAQTISAPPVTTRGVILGTAAYMSPEQARGRAVDKRADIWAFGCVLYEMLSGRKPFEGDTVTDTIVAIVTSEPEWTRLPAATPPHVARLIRRCLEKDPQHRLRDIGDARFDLDPAVRPEAAVARASRRRLLAALVAGVAATIAAFAGGYLARVPAPPPDRGVTRFAIDPSDGLSISRENRGGLALSPDDRAVVFAAGNESGSRLYVKWLDQPEPREIPGTDSAADPFFSPDGRWLGFFANRQLKKVSLADGTMVMVAPANDSTGAAWAPDGTIVFAPGYSSGLVRIGADGGAIRPLTTRNAAAGEAGHSWPDILPDGDHVLYTIEYSGKSFEEADIGVVSLTTGATKILLKGGAVARYSPSGHLVFSRADRLLAVPFDAARLEVTGETTTVATGVSAEIGRGRTHFALSRAGSLAFAPGDLDIGARDLLWVGRDGSLTPASKTRRGFFSVHLSHDGGRVILSVLGSDDDVWMLDLNRDVPTRLTFGTENAVPAWAPDGRRFVWGSDRNGAFNLYLSSIDAPQAVQRLTTSDRRQRVGGFSPDGKLMVYVEQEQVASGDIWMLSVDGTGQPQPLVKTRFNERVPLVSPDGRWLAYASDETGRTEVYVQPFPGPGPKQQVSDGRGVDLASPLGGSDPDRTVRWSSNGRELFYWNGDRLMSVPVAVGREFSSGPPRVVFELTQVLDADVAPDGRRFLVVRESAPPRLGRIVVALGGAAEIGKRAQ